MKPVINHILCRADVDCSACGEKTHAPVWVPFCSGVDGALFIDTQQDLELPTHALCSKCSGKPLPNTALDIFNRE